MKSVRITLFLLCLASSIICSIVEKHGTGKKSAKTTGFVSSDISYPSSNKELKDITNSLSDSYTRILKQTRQPNKINRALSDVLDPNDEDEEKKDEEDAKDIVLVDDTKTPDQDLDKKEGKEDELKKVDIDESTGQPELLIEEANKGIEASDQLIPLKEENSSLDGSVINQGESSENETSQPKSKDVSEPLINNQTDGDSKVELEQQDLPNTPSKPELINFSETLATNQKEDVDETAQQKNESTEELTQPPKPIDLTELLANNQPSVHNEDDKKEVQDEEKVEQPKPIDLPEFPYNDQAGTKTETNEQNAEPVVDLSQSPEPIDPAEFLANNQSSQDTETNKQEDKPAGDTPVLEPIDAEFISKEDDPIVNKDSDQQENKEDESHSTTPSLNELEQNAKIQDYVSNIISPEEIKQEPTRPVPTEEPDFKPMTDLFEDVTEVQPRNSSPYADKGDKNIDTEVAGPGGPGYPDNNVPRAPVLKPSAPEKAKEAVKEADKAVEEPKDKPVEPAKPSCFFCWLKHDSIALASVIVIAALIS